MAHDVLCSHPYSIAQVYKRFRAYLPMLDNKLIKYITRTADASEDGLAAKIARDYNVSLTGFDRLVVVFERGPF